MQDIQAQFQSLRTLKQPIVVTGHTGFKGAWLGMLLEQLQIPYLGISLPPTADSLYSKTSIGKPLREYFQDIRDFEAISRVIEKESPSALIHLAAQPLVKQSLDNPHETFQTNVMGTANLLESFRLHCQNATLGIVTTDKVYKPGNSLSKRHKEEDELLGTEPYSASKVAAENAVISWRKTYERSGSNKIVSLRSGNVIGGGDMSANRLLPDLVRGYLSKERVGIRFPSATRPWQHVLDPLVGYLLALTRTTVDNSHASFNFGPNEPSLSVKEVVAIVEDFWYPMTFLEANPMNEQHETKYLDLDSSLSQSQLGWRPHLSQEAAIISTLRWWETSLNESADKACSADLNILMPTINH